MLSWLVMQCSQNVAGYRSVMKYLTFGTILLVILTGFSWTLIDILALLICLMLPKMSCVDKKMSGVDKKNVGYYVQC